METKKRWYVVQVYTGYEDAVKSDLERAIKASGVEDLFGRILVPSSATSFSGEDEREKIFPGYVLVEMVMNGASFRLVTSLTRVAKFLGGDNPQPLSTREVERIFSQISGKILVSAEKIPFVVGSEISITGGPLAGFVGVVESIDEERKKLTVNVSIFGRMTPYELGFDQVEK